MYIAQRWLFGMVLAMWIGLCSIDMCLKNSVHLKLTEFNELNTIMPPLLENSTITVQQMFEFERKEHIILPVRNKSVYLEYITFIAGACLFLIYYKKIGLIKYTIFTLKTLNKPEMKKYWHKIHRLGNAAKTVSVAIIKDLKICMRTLKQLKTYLLNIHKQQSTPKRNPQNVNLHLLNKLKEYGLERRNLGHVLFASMQENKNIRMLYQLETLAKKRLIKQIEDTQKQLKVHRSRYVGFQQLYTISHQENIFLKSRIQKLTQEKEEAERNLIKLVNYVWQSKHNELKAYCSSLIVKTRNNFLISDAKVEIDKFLKQSSSKQRLSDFESHKLKSLDTIKEVNESFCEEEENLTALHNNAPKLRGLPGECVWTVKDKEGFIEKLYEYDTNFDNGDTIRKIRQYSVYYDKDCLLDVSSSTTLIQSTNIDLSGLRYQYGNKCITGSQAFQKFLTNNQIIVFSRSPLPPPELTY